jgi:hypothetical protein
MENIKKFEDFSLVNEEESASTGITMIIASTTAKLGGPNYDGKGTVLMPAGKYAAGQVNKVKFTIENTGSNNLFLSCSVPYLATKLIRSFIIYFSSFDLIKLLYALIALLSNRNFT